MGAVTSNHSTPPWLAKLGMNGHNLEFKTDTGADVTAIPEALFQKIKGDCGSLRPPDRELFGPSRTILKVPGQVTGTLRGHDITAQEEIYVVRSLSVTFLGHPAIEALRLVARLDAIRSTSTASEVYRKMYPHLSEGLERIQGEHDIKLREEPQPFALTSPRRVALPLLSALKEEPGPNGSHGSYRVGRRARRLVCRYDCGAQGQWENPHSNQAE